MYFFKHHLTVFRLLIVFVLFVILLHKIRPGEIYKALMQSKPHYLIIALVLLIPKLALQIIRWKYLLSNLNPRPSLKDEIMSLFGGFFLAAVSPACTGELARGLWIKGHSKLKIASLTLVDKGFNQFIILLGGIFALFLLKQGLFRVLVIGVGIALSFFVYTLCRAQQFWKKILERFFNKETVENALAAYSALSTGKFWVMFTYTVFLYSVYVSQFYIIFLAFADVSVLTAVQTLPLVFFIDLVLPLSFGGFGIKEMASVTILGAKGFDSGSAFSAAFIQNFLTYLLPGLIGGIIISIMRFLPGRRVLSSSAHNAPS
ncbi:MAG: flippase-like domain-containing protein [Candidatus Latescibacteria bacterium]|nr:flippase-like domain-containing protein [Candidatus Latescibacterota bacterium]